MSLAATNSTFAMLGPELLLCAAACILFLIGCTRNGGKNSAPVVALFALLGALAVHFYFTRVAPDEPGSRTDSFAQMLQAARTFDIGPLSQYIKYLVILVGIMLLLLAFPRHAPAGSHTLDFGNDSGEFFGLALLSLCGVFLVASANDIILLFLALELVSIPTYVMVSISRPLAVAQEAGVKYFFLGALAAALMLFGFSYIYGATGHIHLDEIATDILKSSGGAGKTVHLSPWMMLGVLMLLAGLAFKIAAVPLHFYVGDVYEGAATPVTAFLAFVPKTSGFVAIIKVLQLAGGGSWAIDPTVAKLIWILALLTMSVGNVLALLQQNVKRVLAYSSVAHSGYMLVGLAALAGGQLDHRTDALQGVLFYLAAYGMMNAGAFGVLMLLPARKRPGATVGIDRTCETFDDLLGQGRRHLPLGLAMAVSCFSLIGIPLTVGFMGKFMLLKPALQGHLNWLAILTLVNAAISAAYYLRIVATMFLRDPASVSEEKAHAIPLQSFPVTAAVIMSVCATLFFGSVPAATERLATHTHDAVEAAPNARTPPAPTLSAK